jgi:hypothetical protein
MDARTLARACEPFFSTRFTGRGLGLPAVLGIVRSHSGGLSLVSRPGHGTTVTVLWPLAAPVAGVMPEPAVEIAAGKPAATPAAVTPAAVRPGTILLVDEEPTVLEALADILGASAIPALTAVNGQDAVALFVEHHAERRLYPKAVRHSRRAGHRQTVLVSRARRPISARHQFQSADRPVSEQTNHLPQHKTSSILLHTS